MGAPPKIVGRLPMVAGAWTGGGLIGGTCSFPWWFWMVLVVMSSSILIVTRSNHRRPIFILMLFVFFSFSAGVAGRSVQEVASNHALHWSGSVESIPAHIRCVVSYQRNQWFRGRITSAKSEDKWIPLSGSVKGTLPQNVTVVPGSTIEAFGRFKYSPRGLYEEMKLDVMDTHDISITKKPQFLNVHIDDIRELVADRLTIGGGVNQQLVSAIILGRRDQHWNMCVAPFRATGTAHLMAISGLHLSILSGAILYALGVIGIGPKLATIGSILACINMLLLADVRTPLARAGMMSICGSLFLVGGWRIGTATLLSIAAIGVQCLDPLVVLGPGFQLSFSVVASFVWILPIWNQRCSVSGMRQSKIGLAFRATTTAWCVATPIAAYWFGTMSPIGIPATILLMPLVSVILVAGYGHILCADIPLINTITDSTIDFSCTCLWWGVNVLAALPISSIPCPSTSFIWMIMMLCAACLMIASSRKKIRAISTIIFVLGWVLSMENMLTMKS